MRRLPWILAACVLFAGCNGVEITPRGLIWVTPVTPIVNPVKPIVGDQFRCLILEDAANRNKLSADMQAQIFGKATSDFLKQNCVKDKDGNPQGRVQDGTPDGLKRLTGVWKEMVDKYPPKSLPWLILTNGDVGHGDAWPSSGTELKALMETYAGGK